MSNFLLNPSNEFFSSVTEIFSSTVSISFFSAQNLNFIFYIFEHIKHDYFKIFINTSIVWIIPLFLWVCCFSGFLYVCFLSLCVWLFLIESLKLDRKNSRKDLKSRVMLSFLQKGFIFASG